MIKFVALLAIFAIAAVQSRPATSSDKDEPVQIIRSDNEKQEDGSYSFLFEGADGSFREEKAIARNVGTEDAYLEVTGTYKYVDADGQQIEVHYTADDKGFVPSGTNISDEIAHAARDAAEHAHDEPEPPTKKH